MSDSTTTAAEQGGQSKFRFKDLAACALLLASIGLFDRLLAFVPNRDELGTRTVALHFEPAGMASNSFAPFRLAGSWRVSSEDTRVGGVSGLAIDRGQLLALTDSGALIRFEAPRRAIGKAQIRELPDGPGSSRFKRNRDSEALTRDPQGSGWWVAFENRHELWLYDPRFERALRRIELGSGRWGVNKGVEGLAADGKQLVVIPEGGDEVLRLSGSRARALPIDRARGRIADVAAIGPGRFIAVERRVTPLGFANSLVSLEQSNGAYRFGRRIALPLGPINNVEAIAIEPLPDGAMRIWLMTDDNYQPPLRTLLIALDLPASRSRRSAAEIRSTVSSRADN